MRKIVWNPQEQIVEPEDHTPAPPVPAVPVQTVIQTATKTRAVQVRNGNGHKSEKERELHDSEREWLKNAFLRKNGIIGNDDCVTFKGQMVTESLSIFQITGYISVLHRYVAMGRLQLSDLAKYVQWMCSHCYTPKGQKLWSQWNNPRFKDLRVAANIVDPVVTQPAPQTERVQMAATTDDVYIPPMFKTMPRRSAYFRA